MNRIDRMFGILLYLRAGQTVSSSSLAERFEVSRRTIYRDVEALGASGIPIYAEHGPGGGFTLMEGYYLPPLMFSRDEAIALLLGLGVMRSLRSAPLLGELETAEQKVLAAIPNRLRPILRQARAIIGFEQVPHDIFHPEPDISRGSVSSVQGSGQTRGDKEAQAASVFLRTILDNSVALVSYGSPYTGKVTAWKVQPLGLFWDRGHWYLVGRPCHDSRAEVADDLRLLRADRVLSIQAQVETAGNRAGFDLRHLLEREWLKAAIVEWKERAPVTLRISREHAQRLEEDWYYRHADYSTLPDGDVLMKFGENDPKNVLALLRWLGPGAELVEPSAWRGLIRQELEQMLALYNSASLG